MSQSEGRILVELYAARREGLLTNAVVDRVLELYRTSPPGHSESLGQLLRREQLVSPELSTAIEQARQKAAGVLEQLVGEIERPDREDLETIMETSDADGSPRGGASSEQAGPNTNHNSNPDATLISVGESGSTEVDLSFAPATRYRKASEHAEGGLGKVWIAADRELRRHVALKEIQPLHADDPTCRQRFVREAEITGSLEHPGIVPVYGMGCHADGRPYYAMRLIEGQTLKHAIDDLFQDAPQAPFESGSWKLEFRRILSRFIDVCNTIDYAHSRRVIHRDIKPSNIMLGAYGETLVVDWGLAKVVEPATANHGRTSESSEVATKSNTPSGLSQYPEQKPNPGEAASEVSMMGVAVGTPAYMSPEQASGGTDGTVGYASDIFSLGATLFHLLVGAPPTDDSQRRSDGSLSPATTTRSPRERRVDIPPPLESICEKAMATAPADRYASVKELASDIEAWLAHQPVRAHSEGLVERTARWMRNHPTLVTSSAIAGVLLVVAGAAGLVVRNQHQFDLLQEQQARERQAESHLQQVTAAIDSAEASASIEFENSRYDAALEFLDAAVEQAEAEPSLTDRLSHLVERRDKAAKLVGFYSGLAEAQDVTFMESSRRSTILFQNSLRHLGVFDQLEWWNALPVDDLNATQVKKLRDDAFFALYLLAALRLKETLPGEYTVESFLDFQSTSSENSNQASLVLFDLMDAFRASQGSVLGREFAESRMATLQKMAQGILFQQKTIDWEPRNAADLYVMGSALAFYCTSVPDENQRARFASVLGIDNAEQASLQMLRQASELRPDHYYIQMLVAGTESDRGLFKESYGSYSHAIAIRPEHWAAYHWRGRTSINEAREMDTDDPNRARVLRRAERDIERAIDLHPFHWDNHRLLGDVRTWDYENSNEVVPSYLQALTFFQPLDSLRDLGMEDSARRSLISIRDWVTNENEIRPNNSPTLSCLSWSAYQLGELDQALAAANATLEIEKRDPVARLVIAKTALDRQDLEEADKALIALRQISPNWFHSLMESGRGYEAQSRFDEALGMYAQSEEVAQGTWQKFSAAQAQCRAALQCNRIETAFLALERAMAADPADDLQSLLPYCQSSQAASVKQRIQLVAGQLGPITALDGDRHIRHPALMNGGFELGLTTYWGNTLDKVDRPAWDRSSGSTARAMISETARTGNSALHIVHNLSTKEKLSAELSQNFPVEIGASYQLQVWIKSNQCEESSLAVAMGDQIIIEASAGTYDWQSFTGSFIAKTTNETLRILCRDQCDVLLDDLSIQLEPQVNEKQVE